MSRKQTIGLPLYHLIRSLMDQKAYDSSISTTILIEPLYFETNTKQYKRGQYNTSHPSPASFASKVFMPNAIFFYSFRLV
jgi:hypothetical protein